MNRASDTQTSTTLLNHVADSDEAASAAFVGRYGGMVRALGLHARLKVEDVEDLVQEVMFAAIEALRKNRYDRQRGRFKVWLKGVIRNKITDARIEKGSGLKAQGLTVELQRMNEPLSIRIPNSSIRIQDLPDPHPTPAEEYEAAFETEWMRVAYEEALDEVRTEVEPLTFQAFDLVANKHLRAGQVAKLLGMSRNAIYIAKSRVLDSLQSKLTRADGD